MELYPIEEDEEIPEGKVISLGRCSHCGGTAKYLHVVLEGGFRTETWYLLSRGKEGVYVLRHNWWMDYGTDVYISDKPFPSVKEAREYLAMIENGATLCFLYCEECMETKGGGLWL